MTLKDFMNNVDTAILERGYDYFLNGYVDNLDEVAIGLWAADVYGNETYRVEVKTDQTEIKSWTCDCPYDHGPVCKHVIATFYVIAEKTEKPERKQKKGKKSDKVNEIFPKVSQEELQKFIVMQFRKNRKLKNSFIAHFAELLDEDNDNKYHHIVQSLVKAAQGKYGFIDYHDANSLTTSLCELIQKSEELLADKNRMEALAICKTIIEEVPNFIPGIDDSGGGVYSVFEYAFDNFSVIVREAPPLLKDDLFTYCLAEFPKDKYHDLGFDNHFIQVLPQLITIEEQEKQFFNLIDQQIEIEKKEGYSDYRIVRLINAKVDYLQQAKRENEAQTLIETNKNYPEFRNILVNNAISKKEFNVAKELCNEGIIIAQKEQNRGKEFNWYQKLLETSEIENKIEDIRKYAEKLYYDSSLNLEYYRKLKSTYLKDEWIDRCEKIINKIKGPDQIGEYYKAKALADIFVEEKYFERLLTLMQINQHDINFIDEYAAHVKNLYPTEILTLYENGVKELAIKTGRSIYNEIADYLIKMKKIKGGEEKVNILIKYFREQYKNRRAMKEIFNEYFPETIPKPKETEVQKPIDSNLRLL